MTTPLLVGIDGVNKMGKSLGNYVGITEPPETIFGKMMSISDELMITYYELLSDVGVAELAALKAGMADGSRHPMDAKIALAREIVARFHGAAAAREAEEGFRGRFSRKEFPDDARRVELAAGGGTSDLATVVSRVSGSFTSKSAARRLIAQGGVEVNGERATDPAVLLPPPAEVRLKIGKKEFVVVDLR
jgi:tyrosyl-tRNA synthetase